MAADSHSFRFHRIGGLDQVELSSDADLRALKTLDPKLWVALSCPTTGLEIDEDTLKLLDMDGDGRIRVPEILAAIDWTGARLKDLGEVFQGNDVLPLASIDEQTPEGQEILASVRRILASLGRPDDQQVTLAEAADTVTLFAATTLNGDGIIIAESAEDAGLAALIAEIGECVGTVDDRSGKPGIDAGRVAAFYDAVEAHLAWLTAGDDPAVRTLGDDTDAAWRAVAAVRAKVDDWFTRARLAAFDPDAAGALGAGEASFAALADQTLSADSPAIAALPLARINPDGKLPLAGGINPAWADALNALRGSAIEAILGSEHDTLDEQQWRTVTERVAAYDAWRSQRAGAEVEALGRERLQAIAAGNERSALDALIARDAELEAEFNAVHSVERLIRYRRDLGSLLRNFVNFTEFYSPDTMGAFQAGTLFLDSRSTDLCVRVTARSPLVAMSKAYVVYCDCSRSGGEKMKIAAAITQGDSDYLFSGRNGVFYDRDGRDWDARVTTIIENPISIRQAFWLPYKKLLRKIEETVAKRAAAAEAESDKRRAATASSAANVDQAVPTPPKVDVGAVAAIGVAITGAISALTLILGYVFGMQPWQYPLVLLGIVLVISGPSMVIAWLKLRQRTLGPILEGNGWAINGRVRINVPFGSRLTARAQLPKGSVQSLDDPYRDKAASRRRRLLLLAIVALAALGVWGHAHWMNDGRYFWQSAPPPSAAATIEVAPGDG